MRQLDVMDAITPIDPKTLSVEEKRRVLEYLMFLKEKRNKEIKARGCADGRKQRIYTGKQDSSSKTAALESVFLTRIVEAKEEPDVATVDIPGAFLHAVMDKVVHIILRRKLVDLMLLANREKYI